MSGTPDINVIDVSARDGLQYEENAARLTAATKVEYIFRLMGAGLKRIEAGSFVKPSAVPSMANTAEVAEKLRPIQNRFPDIHFSYLVPNLKGLERAMEASAREVAVFLAVSEEFSRANINAGVDESFAQARPLVATANERGLRVRGYLSTVFGYDDMSFSPTEVTRRAGELLAMGCYEVSLGDTTGIAMPDLVEEVITALEGEGVPLDKIAMHFHDTNGRAIANVERSFARGIRSFDASTGGLGGCPYANSPKGNLGMETLVAWCAAQGLSTDVTDPEGLAHAGAFIRAKLEGEGT